MNTPHPRAGQVNTNTILVYESLPPGQFKTGEALHQRLQPLTDLPIQYIRIADGDELLAHLGHLVGSCKRGTRPIVHIECHGDGDLDGLRMADESHVSWSEIARLLSAINLASDMNLMLGLSACFGAYISDTIAEESPTPFIYMLSPRLDANPDELLIGYVTFYRMYLTGSSGQEAADAAVSSGRDIFTSVNAFHCFQSAVLNGVSPKYWSNALIYMLARERCVDGQSRNQLLTLEEAEADIRRSYWNWIAYAWRRCFAWDANPENIRRFPLRIDSKLLRERLEYLGMLPPEYSYEGMPAAWQETAIATPGYTHFI
jgi:hypothetical protein